jgi:hypothetical protein
MAVNLSQARRSTRNQCAEYGFVDVLGLESIALEQKVECRGDLDQKLFHSSSGRPSAAMVLL